MPTNHLDNQTAFSLVWLILNSHFASLDRSIPLPSIDQTSLEDRKQCLTSDVGSTGKARQVKKFEWPTLLYIWQVNRPSPSLPERWPLDGLAENSYFSKKTLLSRAKDAYADLDEFNAVRMSYMDSTLMIHSSTTTPRNTHFAAACLERHSLAELGETKNSIVYTDDTFWRKGESQCWHSVLAGRMLGLGLEEGRGNV